MKRNYTFRIILISLFIILSLYFLYPAYRYSTLSEDELAELDQAELMELKAKTIKQGLDLQGGMHLVLEVDLVQLIDNLVKNKDEKFSGLKEQIEGEMATSDEDFFSILNRTFRDAGVNLVRYFDEGGDTEGEILDWIDKEAKDAINRTLEILRNRVDQFGVSEPLLQRQGSRRLIIELPGITDPDRAKSLIGKTALLEFKLLKPAQYTQNLISSIDDVLRGEEGIPEAVETLKEKEAPDTAKAQEAEQEPAVESQDKEISVEELFGETPKIPLEKGEDATLVVDERIFEDRPFSALVRGFQNDIKVPEKNAAALRAIIEREDIRKLYEREAEFLWSSKTDLLGDGNLYYTLYVVNPKPELTGSAVAEARVEIGSGYDPKTAGRPIVALNMNRKGARIFSRVTGANIGERLAIILDNKVYMAPVIKVKIPDGRSIIEGSESMNEARDLTIVLRAGALPAPVNIVEERTVGPSLGRDSIRMGKNAAVIGLVLVVCFMFFYYKIAGLIADLALFLNILFIFAVLAGFHATLTLPGIAGIILTIGIAVDANVLIFERIREELRTGKTIRASIANGYSRAFRTILDANVTTFIAGIVLYQFGTGPIKGFALTLMIGIIASMFTALVVTRVIFDYMTDRMEVKTLSI